MHGFDRFAIGTAALLALGAIAYDTLDPMGFSRQLLQEHSDHGAGVVEHLTFFVLLPGIACGIWALWRRRDRLRPPIVRAWLLAWTCACVYFAGEEVSWGYWYFGWETPDAVARLNDQGETNLHNMSSWLDQKPRALVELFVLIAGVVLPLARRSKGQDSRRRDNAAASLMSWIVAPASLVPAALLFVAVRLVKYLPDSVSGNLGDSELRELAVACFLSLYLISFAARLRTSTAQGGSSAYSTTASPRP